MLCVVGAAASAMRLAAGTWTRKPTNWLTRWSSTSSATTGRNGDLLRLAHPKAPSAQHEAVFRWILAGVNGSG